MRWSRDDHPATGPSGGRIEEPYMIPLLLLVTYLVALYAGLSLAERSHQIVQL